MALVFADMHLCTGLLYGNQYSILHDLDKVALCMTIKSRLILHILLTFFPENVLIFFVKR